ncbi:hypothetical protein JKP31_22000 [Vibrio vulnificus]|uniref:hypothetical protein n=1 Tax=Vibrio vulnificus TaxID=672 RepID=UPI001CDC5906|nr:hypothetical protein [Vibrio vulnificus]MCA3903929.1 hypothetical protein [Vibrio vulnificus]
MSNDINQTTEKIANEIKSGAWSIQAVFDTNIQRIESLQAARYSLVSIYRNLVDKLGDDYDLSKNHFKNLIHRARKKGTSLTSTPEPVREERKPLTDAANSAPKEEKKTNQTDRTDWITIGVTMPILIAKLEKAGFTPDDVSSWGLPNEIQISNRLTEYMMKKS